MPENDYYKSIPEDVKRDLAFNVVAGIREAISIAQKKQTPPTYEQALRILHDIEPNLYSFCSAQLQNKNENDLAKLFKDKAAIASVVEGKTITPEELLLKEIEEHQELIADHRLEKERTKSIKRHIGSLSAALENMQPRRLTEHRILERDFIKADRSSLGAEKFMVKDDYVDYKLAPDRFLRMRIFHPDRAEHILGADLIYERYNVETEKVRIAVLQYKVWEDNGALYFGGSDNRSLKQMQKLHNNLCKYGMCKQPEVLAQSIDYRFPYCSAFLRPTDRMQDPNSKMISSGAHIPICSCLNMVEVDRKIVKSEIRHTALTHEVFEHLFNHGLVGSRPLGYEDLEDFYKDLQVLEDSRTLKIYAKEVLVEKRA